MPPPTDVFVQAAATKVMGMISYHTVTAVVPFGPFCESNFNDGTRYPDGTRPPLRVAGSHHCSVWTGCNGQPERQDHCGVQDY